AADQHVEEAGGGGLGGAKRLAEVDVQFRRHQADVPLDVPDALATAALPAEQADVVGVRLRGIAAEPTEQRRLAGAVGPQYRPGLACPHRPAEAAQDVTVPIGDVHVSQFDDRGRVAERAGSVSDGCLSVAYASGSFRVIAAQPKDVRHPGGDV